MLVLVGRVGIHKTDLLQLLRHQWLEHRLGLLWWWMVCLGNEPRLFCHFWGCTILGDLAAWLFASLSYVSPFITTRQWSMKGIHSRGGIYMYTCSVTSGLCDPMDYSPPGFSVHRILQARILEWTAISSSRESSWHRDGTLISCISCIGRRILYHWVSWEAHNRGEWLLKEMPGRFSVLIIKNKIFT